MSAIVLFLAFILMVGYFFGLFSVLDEYVMSVFGVSVYEYVLPLEIIAEFLTREFLILLCL